MNSSFRMQRAVSSHRHCSAQGRARVVPCAAAKVPRVLLTREEGKNEKMVSGLKKHGMECIELPLIEHTDGPERAQLPAALQGNDFDWVTVTSPEAANVFLEAWAEAGKPKLRVAVVGGGTGEVLQAAGVIPDYTATKATGKVMGAELPRHGSNRVLYPASAKASTDLQDALAASGFTVRRMNTYNTSGVQNVAPELLQAALTADIVTFGSPSAVKAWVQLVGLQAASEKLSVCIGSTSARACDAAGLPKGRTYFPDSPGVEGWIDSVLQACSENGLKAPAVTA